MNMFKNKNSHKGKEHSPMKHMLHMILCCGLPIIIIAMLPFIASFSPAMAGVLGVIAPFICPVMMGGMMIMMFCGNKKSCCAENKVEVNNEISKKD
jgi:glucan phosphoethanolaminetransferase (alkaline phosphatase superfamily)